MEEFYDIQDDPHCMNNLAGDPQFASLKDALWSELSQVLHDTGDPRIFGNGDIFENYEYCLDVSHSWAHYLAGDWRPQNY